MQVGGNSHIQPTNVESRARASSVPTAPQILSKTMDDGAKAERKTRSASMAQGNSTRATTFNLPKPLQNSINAFSSIISKSLQSAGFSSSSKGATTSDTSTKSATTMTSTATTTGTTSSSTPTPTAAKTEPTRTPAQEIKERATELVKQQFMDETKCSGKKFDSLKDTPAISKLIDSKINEINSSKLNEVSSDQKISQLGEKLIGIAVGNKNGLSDTVQFQASLKATLGEAKSVLTELPKSGLSHEEMKTKESEINSIIKVLTAISQKGQPTSFNEAQTQVIGLLNKTNRNADEGKELNGLVNKMTKDEIMGIVNHQVIDDFSSTEPKNAALSFSNSIQQNINSSSPLFRQNFLNESPLKQLIDERNTVYSGSYRATSEHFQKMEAGYDNAKNSLTGIYGAIKDVFELGGVDFKKVIEDSEAKVKGASPENRGAALEEMKTSVNADYKQLLADMRAKVLPQGVAMAQIPTETKDKWKAQLQEKLPQYNAAIYNPTPPAHGFDRIFAHLSSPAATDTVTDTMKSQMSAKAKLDNTDVSQTGIEYKRPEA